MTDQGRKRPSRGYAASRFDEFTLAAFTVLLIVIIGAVFTIGMATAKNRLGCGLDNLVHGVLSYQRPCR